MNGFEKAAVAIALAGLAAPAAAQMTGFEGMQFVDAIRAGKDTEALNLLEASPNIVNARNSKGDTALIVAVAERNDGWVGELLRSGADPNLAARNGDTPLIAAARIGYTQAAQWLLGRKAKVDSTNRMGETALIVAVQQRHIPMIKLLLDQGADPDKTDAAAGFSARDYAARDTRNREIIRMIEAKKPKAPAL